MAEQTPAAEPPFDTSLIGRYVLARTARRERSGVILPPVGRSRKPRLALDDGRMVPLEAHWAIENHPSLRRDRKGQVRSTSDPAPGGQPTYRKGDLPAHLLATRTMLRTEHRRRPRPGQPVIAWYSLLKEWAPLYAIADSEPLPALSGKRAEAWTAARTCRVCGTPAKRPLPLSPGAYPERYCTPCRQKTAEFRWITQSRAAQADMASWARDVLTDPLTVLAAAEDSHIDWIAPGYRVETADGQVLLDAHVHTIPDERIATCQPDVRKRLEGTVFVGDLLETIRLISERRIVTWYGGELDRLPSGLWKIVGDDFPRTLTDPADRLGERFRLWTGESPGGRYEWWYPEPKLPWSWTGSGEHERGYKTAQTAKARIHWMREYLTRMAEQDPPEPTVRGGSWQAS
jgi:hypothetical protein